MDFTTLVLLLAWQFGFTQSADSEDLASTFPSQKGRSTAADEDSRSAFQEVSTYGEEEIPFFRDGASPGAQNGEAVAASAEDLLRLVDLAQKLQPLRPVPSAALRLTGKSESLDEKALKRRAKARRGELLRRDDTALQEKQQQLKGKYVEGTDVAELHAEVYRLPWWRRAIHVALHFLSTGGMLPDDEPE